MLIKGNSVQLCVNKKKIVFCILILWGVVVSVAEAKLNRNQNNRSGIFLVTILPGDALYSSFGHTAIRVVDPSKRSDLLYNYGASVKPFDIFYLLDLLRGKMDFMVDSQNTALMYSYYKEVENRTIIEQELVVEQATFNKLIARLDRDMLPGQRIYRYRFLTNNCTTKAWDAIKESFVFDATPMVGKPKSYRQWISGVLNAKPMTLSIINLLLGPYGDKLGVKSVSPFLPQELMYILPCLRDANGNPVMASQSEVYKSTREKSSFIYKQISIIIAVFILIISIILLLLFSKQGKIVNFFDLFLFLFAALLGFIILTVWLIAGYPEVSWNINLLWASPLLLGVFLKCRGKGFIRFLIWLLILSTAVFVIGCGFFVQAISLEWRIIAAAICLRLVARLQMANQSKNL